MTYSHQSKTYGFFNNDNPNYSNITPVDIDHRMIDDQFHNSYFESLKQHANNVILRIMSNFFTTYFSF